MTSILARRPGPAPSAKWSPMSPQEPAEPVSPKDRFVTVYGRKPVLEALADPALEVDKVVLADDADARSVRPLLDAAKARGVAVQRASAHRVKVLAGNGRQDQGVIADVVAPRHAHRRAVPRRARPRRRRPACSCSTA